MKRALLFILFAMASAAAQEPCVVSIYRASEWNQTADDLVRLGFRPDGPSWTFSDEGRYYRDTQGRDAHGCPRRIRLVADSPAELANTEALVAFSHAKSRGL